MAKDRVIEDYFNRKTSNAPTLKEVLAEIELRIK